MRVDKKKLLKFVRERGTVTFTDLEEFFEQQHYNFRGEAGILLKDSRLAAWNGWNKRTFRVFMDLVKSGKISMERTGMANAPMPPAFRDKTGLSEMNYVPILIKAEVI